MYTYKFYDSADYEEGGYVELEGNETVDSIKNKIYGIAESYIAGKYGEDCSFLLIIKCGGDVIFNEIEQGNEIGTFTITEHKDKDLEFECILEDEMDDDLVDLN